MKYLSEYIKRPISVIEVIRIFGDLQEKGIKEIYVNNQEMYSIVANVVGNSGQTEYGAEALRTGKVNEYMGIKICQ